MTAAEPIDSTRLETQLDYVRYAMRKGEWWTFADLIAYVRPFCGTVSEAGVSARIRDLRKEGYTVEREKVRQGGNLYRYRLVPGSNEPQGMLF